jgi:hypothetical protein
MSDDNLSESHFHTIELGDSDSTEPTPSPASARKTLKARKEAVKGKGKGKEKSRLGMEPKLAARGRLGLKRMRIKMVVTVRLKLLCGEVGE